MAFTELHFHLLPGIDDGPRSLADSAELAAAAAREGTRTIVATPHVHPQHVTDPTELPERVAEVQAYLRREGIEVDVRCGGELAHGMVGALTQRQLEAIAHGPRGRRWVLLEASLRGLDGAFTAAADELRARGLAVVMAHPERALLGRCEAWPVVEHELAAGSAMQVNAWSVAGRYGDAVRRDALRVLAAAPVAAIASDAHGRQRMPALGLALEALRRAGDGQRARRLSAVPAALLHEGLAPGGARRPALVAR